MRTTVFASAALVALADGFAAAELPPEPPSPAAVAALVALPKDDCNGAVFYLQAEEVWRRDEMQKPAEQTQRLPESHPAFPLMLEAARCRRFELPYSASMAIPPTSQPIPASRLYWGVATTLVERAARLRSEGRADAARLELDRVVVLGLQLYDDPGITYVQHIIALKTVSMGLQGLGDMAIASGQEELAAGCARVLARSRAYVDGLSRFLREDLTGAHLPSGPGLLPQVRKLSAYFDATESRTVRGEILLFLATAQAVATDTPVRESARAALTRATRDADPRLNAVARWGLQLDRPAAEALLREMQRNPAPLTQPDRPAGSRPSSGSGPTPAAGVEKGR